MDNPDSTVENNMFQAGYLFNPRSNRLREDEGHAPNFAEVFPQKNIKWRSPLVNSPTEKFSPPTREFCFNFGEKKPANKDDTNENNHLCLGAEDTSSSNTKLNPFEASGKPVNISSAPSSKSLKKNSKNQFPLSDQNYSEEVNNDSFYEKIHEFDAFCGLEELGLTAQKKESAKNPSVSSKSYVGKYYSELLRNSQNKSDQNESKSIPKSVTSTQSSEKKSAENVQQQSQDLFTQNDFLPISEPTDRGNFSSDCNTKNYHDMKSFTQPVHIEYQYNHNFPIRNRTDPVDALNASFVGPPDYNFAVEELAQRRHFNPYLDEYRHNPYFSHQEPTRHPYMCCVHNPTRYPNANPYYNPHLESDYRRFHRMSQACRSCISDMPENYIDHSLQQIDDQPLRFVGNRDINRYSTRYFEDVVQHPVNNRSMLNFEQAPSNETENLPDFQREARSYTPFFPETPNTQLQGAQDVRKIYVPTPKIQTQRQVAYGPPPLQSQINFEKVSSNENENLSYFKKEARSYTPLFSDAPNTQLHGAQMLTQNVRQMYVPIPTRPSQIKFEKLLYVPTTKSQVAYGPPAFQGQINFEKASSNEKENLPDFKREATFFPEKPNTQFQEAQVAKQNLRKMFVLTPKRQLASCSPAFQSQIHPSTGAQRRILNFNSFEERLNNSIIPCSRGSSSSAARNERFHQPSDEQIINGFILPNNQNRI